MWRNRQPFRKTFPELVDELFGHGEAPPCIIVFVDCWTSYGGSQFLDSPGTGRYHTHLCEEVVPWVDARYRTLAEAQHRGIAGKSSAGYDAMVTPMLRPDLFGGLAAHAGNALFVAALPGVDDGICQCGTEIPPGVPYQTMYWSSHWSGGHSRGQSVVNGR